MGLEERIKQARKKANLSQQQLAKILGLSFMTIRRWEAGEVSPRVEELQKLSDVLDTSVEFLMGLKNEIKPQITQEQIFDALNWASKIGNEEVELKEPVTTGTTGDMLIINDKNINKEIRIPNTPEGRKFFVDLLKISMGLKAPSVSNQINGDHNNDNHFNVITQ